jgi:hypothetical protein
MGLYDSIYTNYRLPNIEVTENLTLIFNSGNTRHFGYETEFQTKDFDCILDRYLISSHGRLLLTSGGVNQDTNYHGILRFHTVVTPPMGGGYYIEYHCKFSDGKIVEVNGKCNHVSR